MSDSGFTVVVLDMFHYMDPDYEVEVPGFKTIEEAREYARRRTRASLESVRPQSGSPADLRSLWFQFGEDCLVMGGEYSGNHELDYFIVHPATEEECDWESLTPESE